MPSGFAESAPRFRRWIFYVAAVTVLFARPLTQLFAHAIQSEFYSHVPFIPLVSGYLLYSQVRQPASVHGRSITGTIVAVGIGIAALAAGIRWRDSVSVNDELALMALAYVSFIIAGAFVFLGSKWIAAHAFPFLFLVFMIPLPDAAVTWMETMLVLASAEVAALFVHATGTPLLRAGTIFALPGIVLKVAQECSGIHSSWVLLITSTLASQLFLNSPWRRIVLIAFVIPLGIARNAFRILVIGLLCVHVGPHMIDSQLHRQGGPIFFALSLVPLVLLLAWLRRTEQRKTPHRISTPDVRSLEIAEGS